MTRKVLFVDDDAAVREALGQTLELAELETVVAGSFIEAKDHIAPGFDGVIVSDIRMPGRDGFFLLGHVQKVDAELPVILLTGEGDIPMAVKAMGEGAFGFLEKPCAPADLLAVVERALKTRALVLENRRLKAQLEAGDPAAIAMQRGGSVADVWIVSDNPVSVETMLPTDKEPYTRPQPGILPSRAADNLYWLGRYVERAENIMRLLRAYHLRLAESANEDLPIIRNLTLYLHMLKIDPKVPVPEPLLATIRSAINSALRIRDRFSVDGWTALNELSRTAGRFAAYVSPGDDAAHAYGEMLRRITAFSGLVHENMYRFSGWRFLTIGRSLERADAMASVLAWFADATAPEGALDLAVEFGDSVMTHRRRYAVATNRNNAIDLLVLDALNPRSILYQIGEIKTHVSALPRIGEEAQMTPLERFVLKLHTGIAIRMPSDLKATDFLNVRNDLGAISDLLSETYLG